MAYNDNNTSPKSNTAYVRETRVEKSSGPGMPLLIVGMAVAIGIILWLVIGATGTPDTTTGSQPAGDTTNVTVEPSADTTTSTTTAPAADTAAPAADAPAATAPAADVPAADAPAADAPAADAPATTAPAADTPATDAPAADAPATPAPDAAPADGTTAPVQE